MIWLSLSVYAAILTSFGLRVKVSEQNEIQALFDYGLFPAAFLMFLGMIVYAAIRMPSMEPKWLRPIAAVSIFYLICFAFGGIAERLDGDRGLLDIIQYGFEFYVRAIDMFSFGALQHAYPRTFDEAITLTKSGSVTVILFNAVMSMYGFGLIMKLAFSFLIGLRRRPSRP